VKAMGLTEFGGPEVLQVVTLPSPQPGPGEVRIRVHAVAVNPTDATFRAGGRAAQLADRAPPVHAPKNATDAEAATLLLNAVAAQLALDALGLPAGQAVAVTGAAGAVGGYAIQLARMRGLTVIADAPPGEEGLIRRVGASHVLARGPGFAAGVRSVVPGGVPGLVDGANLDAAALPAIADGGAIATVKGWSGPAGRGITVHPISAFTAATNTALLEDLRDLAEHGVLTLRTAGVVPASQAAEAHRRLAGGGLRGRIVLDFESPLTAADP
jgi:NADPH:quinone reductase